MPAGCSLDRRRPRLQEQKGGLEAALSLVAKQSSSLKSGPMLLKARQQNELIRRVDVTRKNSVSRILVENSVIESLKQTGRIRGTRSLYRDACLIVGTLKESTFRTILHRMKNRGLISSVADGKWQIASSALTAP